VAGKTHDKKVTDDHPISHPRCFTLGRDTGFQEYEPKGVIIFQPKKHKGQDLINLRGCGSHMVHQTTNQYHSTYRADIDGLRAVAVLAVIVFHINKDLLPGGFIGVDVFFVISGYLISLIIIRDINTNKFSIAEFYRRRIKRIFPPLTIVLVTTIVLSQLILLPVAKSGLWSSLSMANVYFWLFQDTSYFATASNQLPLLHLWSLGIEEQFYIIWPFALLLFLRSKHKIHFFAVFGLIGIVSYALGEFLFSHAPSFSYYMLPTRAGELLLGGILAQFIIKKEKLEIPKVVVSMISLLGLLMIIGSLFLLSENSVFPGVRALLPTLGTAALIISGHYGNAAPNRLLKLKPMPWIGSISYSAYLWHWPILAFYRYGNFKITLLSGTIIFFITLFIAWLSYAYIETPARNSKKTIKDIVIYYFLAPSVVIILGSAISISLRGYGLRWFSEEYRTIRTTIHDQTRPATNYDYVCQYGVAAEIETNDPNCVIGNNKNISPKAILWGDSNAAHYIGILGTFANEAGFQFRNLEVGACPPINTDVAPFAAPKRVQDCNNSQELIFKALNEYQVIIISASWNAYFNQDKFMDAVFETVQSLADDGKLIILLGKAPVHEDYDRLCLEKAVSFPWMICEYPDKPLSMQILESNKKLQEFASQHQNVEYYDFNKFLCPNGYCSVYDENGYPLYYDDQHLSLDGSWRLGKQIYEEVGVPYPFTLISK
jgi:peptidoglycan/LPS O-acetylase OafA/YrhL